MPKSKAAEDTKPSGPGTPKPTKLTILVGLLRQPKGATIEEMQEATGWQAHSVRGAMSGSLKKAKGLTVTSEKSGNTRVYRISAEPSA